MDAMNKASGDYTPNYKQSQDEFRATSNRVASIIQKQRNANGWKTLDKDKGRYLYTFVHNSGWIKMTKLVEQTKQKVKKDALLYDFDYEIIEIFEHKAKVGRLPKVEILIQIL